MKFIAVIGLMPILLQITVCTIPILENNNIDQLSECLSNLVTQLFSKQGPAIVLSDGDQNVLANMNFYPYITVNINNPFATDFKATSTNNYIIYTNGTTKLNNTLIKLQASILWDKSINLHANYIVIVPDDKHLEEIFQIFCKFDIHNVLILVWNEIIGQNLALRLFQSNGCFKKTVVDFVGICTKNISLTNFGRLQNLKGRWLKLLLHKIRVYPTLVDPYLKPKPGVIISLIHLIGEKTEASVSVIVTNLTTESVLNKKTDNILLTYFLARYMEYYEDYDISQLIYQDPMVWVVPKAKQLSRTIILVNLFSENIWQLIVTLIMVILAWYVMSKLSAQDHIPLVKCILSIYGLMINGASVLSPKSHALRLFLVFYGMYCLNIYTFFQAKITGSLLYSDTEPEIYTVEDMVNTKLEPIVSKLGYRQLNSSTEPVATTLIQKCQISEKNVSHNLFKVAYQRNYSTHIGERLLSTYKKERNMVHVINYHSGLQDIEITLALRKGHPAMPIINKIITSAMEAGLIEKWLSDAGKFKYIDSQQLSASMITIKHLNVFIILWIIGLTIATAVFIAELLYKKWKWKNTSNRCYKKNKWKK